MLTNQALCPEPEKESTEAQEPLNFDKMHASKEWQHWEATLHAEYNSLQKHNVFGELLHILTTKPISHKLIFIKKRDAYRKLLCFKVRLVAQRFSQRPGIDYDSTCSCVMDSSTFPYRFRLVVQLSLQTQLPDVVTTYLHVPLETRLYIRPPPLFCDTKLSTLQIGHFLGLRIQKAFYGLNEAGRLWYKHLYDFLLDHKFINDVTLHCIFVYKQGPNFVILAIYVDNINLMGTSAACHYAESHLQSRFDIKLLSRISLYLRL